MTRASLIQATTAAFAVLAVAAPAGADDLRPAGAWQDGTNHADAAPADTAYGGAVAPPSVRYVPPGYGAPPSFGTPPAPAAPAPTWFSARHLSLGSD